MSDAFIAARPKRAALPQPLPSSSDAQPYQDLGQEVMPVQPPQPVATGELAVLEQIAMYLQQVPPPDRQRILRLLTMLLP
jgi:hypothetical protein